MARDEMRFLKMHNKVENLKSQNLWSFRQIVAHVPPLRPKCHHDYMLEEAVCDGRRFLRQTHP